MLIAAISSANASLYASSRFLHSLGHDRLAPAPLTRVNARKVPVPALLVSALGIVAAAVLAGFGVSGVFNILVSIAIFCVFLVWLLILASYLAFRRARPAITQPAIRVWGGAMTGCVGIAGVLAVITTAVVVPAMRQAIVCGTAFALALLLIYVLRIRPRLRAQETADPSGEGAGAS